MGSNGGPPASGKRSDALATPRWLAALGLGVFLGCAAFPMLVELTRDPDLRVFGFNDWWWHLAIADEASLWPPRLPYAPHLLFHVLTRSLSTILDHTIAAAVVGSAAVGAAGAAAVITFSRRDMSSGRLTFAALLAAAFAVGESPSVIVLLDDIVRGAGPLSYPLPGPIQRWGSPTHVMQLPFIVATVPVLLWALRASIEHRFTTKHRQVLLAITLAGVVAKPSITLAVLPAMVVMLATSRAPARVWSDLGRWGIAPGFAAVAVQTAWMSTQAGTQRPAPGLEVHHEGIALASPIARMSSFGWFEGTPAYWLFFTLPLICLLVGGARYLTDGAVRIALFGFPFTIIPGLLLRELSGPNSGNDLTGFLHVSLLLLLGATYRWVAMTAIEPGSGIKPAGRRAIVTAATLYALASLLSSVALVVTHFGS